MSSPKYYLGFVFDRFDTVNLHCTHAYFGTINADNLKFITTTVDYLFYSHGRGVGLRHAVFDKLETFKHQDGESRVLLMKDRLVLQPFAQIRAYFESRDLISTTYPFRPHVTIGERDIKSISGFFHSYVLVKDGEVVKRWLLRKDTQGYSGVLQDTYEIT